MEIYGKALVVAMVVLLVYFVYEIVIALWSIDICVSYFQRYGNFSYTVPLTDKTSNTWDCYHESLNNVHFYIISLVAVSLILGILVGVLK